MWRKGKVVTLFLAVLLACFSAAGAPANSGDAAVIEGKNAGNGDALLWRSPDDIASRNLFYGSGGKKDVPPTAVTFLKEDLNGSNPKFDVRDENGVKWKVKLGDEARPETVASRLIWAVGYFTTEDYFVARLQVAGMPAHLKRGQKLVGSGGSVLNVRLKRSPDDEKKIEEWNWRRNPFTGTRQLNGLRVMMALVNNWDLKNPNNAVYEDKKSRGNESYLRFYMVSDLGASFGATGRAWPRAKSRGNMEVYSHSKFISKVTPDYIDFAVPSRPALFYSVNLPEFIRRLHSRWIGKRIPRADAKWMGQLLSGLSTEQIRDAFRAAGYAPNQVGDFASVIEERIGELNEL